MKNIGLRVLTSFVGPLLYLVSPGVNAQQPIRVPGVTAVGASAPAIPVTIKLSRSGVVSRVKVVTQGSEGLEFQNAGDDCQSLYAAGQICTVNVTFRPAFSGERHGAIVLLDRDNRPLATKPLAATASGSIFTFIPGQIITVAGNSSTFFFSGDGGPATKASLFIPFGVTLDAADHFYIADTFNDRIRVVNIQTGIISTVAGSGASGAAGDNGPALSAELNNPSTVILDAAGNLYIADTNNDAIRVVNASTGVISTFAGTLGTTGYTGDNGPAALATLKSPNGLAFDSNLNLYIADTGNNVIRVVNSVTGFISTVAGTGVAGYSGDGGSALAARLRSPFAVTLSTSDALYIADQSNNAVREVSTSGMISTIAGNGTAAFGGDHGVASSALLNAPTGLVFDVAGNLYISDSGNNRVRKINPATQIITTIAGGAAGDGDNNPATLANLSGPFALALDGAGNLYIADAFHNRIRQIESNTAAVDFTTTRVNSVTAPMAQVVENDGTATLNISSINAVSNAVVDATSTCTPSTQLSVLAQCTIGVDFAPIVTGIPTRGSIAVDSNAINANSTIILQGVADSTDPSTVLVSSNPNPSLVGNPVQFTIQVVSAGVTPTGKVTLLDGTTTLGTFTLTNGIATTSISSLVVGQHTITSSYGGDTNNGSATSLPYVQVVDALPANSNTTTMLTSTVNPIQVGMPLTLNATVAAVATNQPTPTGTVSFMEGTTVLGMGIVSSGITSTTISTLTAGTHLITAVYSGSATYATSTSPVLTQVVTALNPSTTTSLTSNADPIAVGATLTLTADVSAVGAGQAVPSGPVSFMEGTNVLGTGTLAAGTTSIMLSNLTAGTHLITAVFGGSTNYSTSTSPILTEIVGSGTGGSGNVPQFTLTLTPSSLTIPSGSHSSIQVTLTTQSVFTDTLSFGCGGLPAMATCTFSQNQLAVSGGVTKSLSVAIDTSDPLGAGPSAQIKGEPSKFGPGVLACALPGAFFALLFFRRRRFGFTTGLLGGVLALIAIAGLSGCGSSFTPAKTPAGMYTIQIFATGSATGESYATPVQLTVTK